VASAWARAPWWAKGRQALAPPLSVASSPPSTAPSDRAGLWSGVAEGGGYRGLYEGPHTPTHPPAPRPFPHLQHLSVTAPPPPSAPLLPCTPGARGWCMCVSAGWCARVPSPTWMSGGLDPTGHVGGRRDHHGAHPPHPLLTHTRPAPEPLSQTYNSQADYRFIDRCVNMFLPKIFLPPLQASLHPPSLHPVATAKHWNALFTRHIRLQLTIATCYREATHTPQPCQENNEGRAGCQQRNENEVDTKAATEKGEHQLLHK
jgi:hypothetical protein